MIFIIEDDPVMAECMALATRRAGKVEIRIFSDVISAVQALDRQLPKLIFLDILLSGPDGFTLLNELSSYDDTSKIPIVIVSSLALADVKLSHYGVVKILDKATMTPAQVTDLVRDFLDNARLSISGGSTDA